MDRQHVREIDLDRHSVALGKRTGMVPTLKCALGRAVTHAERFLAWGRTHLAPVLAIRSFSPMKAARAALQSDLTIPLGMAVTVLSNAALVKGTVRDINTPALAATFHAGRKQTPLSYGVSGGHVRYMSVA